MPETPPQAEQPGSAGAGAPPPKKPVMRALGQSLGILWKAIREPVKEGAGEGDEEGTPSPKDPESERQIIEEETKQIEQGQIILRETTIREIEVTPMKRIEDDSRTASSPSPSPRSPTPSPPTDDS